MKKVHIGPGKTYLPGWNNVDIFSSVRADLYTSALALPFERNSIDIIYASHVLEHFNRHLVLAALTHWRDLLKEEGILRLAVPNFDSVVKVYSAIKEVSPLLGLLYGGQSYMLDTHHIIFNNALLEDCLVRAGFKKEKIREWDWKETEHSCFDDYSQAYFPHMDKEKGILMSLNVEAVK